MQCKPSKNIIKPPSPLPSPARPDIESCIDWWLALYLPPGALPPAALQAAINGAYSAAEDEDGAAGAAEAVLAVVPEVEAEVIRAELARIKLSGGWAVGWVVDAGGCF